MTSGSTRRLASWAFAAGSCAAANLGALTGAGCGPTQPPCPNDLPDACPAQVPSFQTQVFPLIQGHCQECHSPVTARKPNLSTYDAIYAERTSILSQIYSCQMPGDADHLSAEDRATLLGWFVCGAPNN
jgi:hypothetical protein